MDLFQFFIRRITFALIFEIRNYQAALSLHFSIAKSSSDLLDIANIKRNY